MQAAVVAHHRNPSATASRNHQHALAHQRANHFQFDNLDRLRRRHHAAISASSVFHDLPSQQALPLLGLRPRIKRPNRLRRMLHGRIVGRNQALRHQADHRHMQSAAAIHSCSDCASRYPISPWLAAPHTSRVWPGTQIRRPLRTQQLRPHLRPVPVRNHQVIAIANQPDDRAAVRRAFAICSATVPFSPARIRELPPTAMSMVFMVRSVSSLSSQAVSTLIAFADS